MIVGLILALCACSPKIVEHTERVIERDTVVKMVKVPIEIQVPVEVHMAVEEDSSHLETSVAESDAWVDREGKIHHTLYNKDVTLKSIDWVPYTTVTTGQKDVITNVVEVEKKLSWLQRTLIYIGMAALAILILWVCKRIFWK